MIMPMKTMGIILKVRVKDMSEEAKEGKNAFIEKRQPDFSKFPRVP